MGVHKTRTYPFFDMLNIITGIVVVYQIEKYPFVVENKDSFVG
jgi:hypothetical protein